MDPLSRLVSEDSRPALARLRRCKLWELADARGIPYPTDATKDQMLQVLQGAGLDPNQPADAPGVKWRQIVNEDENKRQHIEMYPESEPHATAKKDIDYADEIEKRAAKAPPTSETDREQAFEASRIDALERENAELKLLIEQRLGALETKAAPELPLESMLAWQLQKLAKARGVATNGARTKEELIAILQGADDGKDPA